MIAASGYGDWKYSKNRLERTLDLLKVAVPQIMVREKCDGIVLHGSSGVWLGSALVLNDVVPSGCGLFLVRKPGEQSHGEIVEGDGENECSRLLMIDDFVSTGDSVRRVQSLIEENKVRPATIVAVLQHDRLYDHDYSVWKPGSLRVHSSYAAVY